MAEDLFIPIAFLTPQGRVKISKYGQREIFKDAEPKDWEYFFISFIVKNLEGNILVIKHLISNRTISKDYEIEEVFPATQKASALKYFYLTQKIFEKTEYQILQCDGKASTAEEINESISKWLRM